MYLDTFLLLFLFFHADGGVVYIRWGKKTCPEGAHLVYSGIT